MPTVPIQGDYQVPVNDLSAAIDKILVTIRHMESNSNYTAQSKNSTASGAYQIIDSTWKSWASYVSGASQYTHAKDAPPTVQDAVAGAAVNRILASHDYWLSSVPINWYQPTAWDNPTIANKVPAGNTLTPVQYASKWVKWFTDLHYIPQNPPFYGLPDPVTPAIHAIGSVVDFLKLLADPSTWMRVIKVIGGAIGIFIGIVTLARALGAPIPSATDIARSAKVAAAA